MASLSHFYDFVWLSSEGLLERKAKSKPTILEWNLQIDSRWLSNPFESRFCEG